MFHSCLLWDKDKSQQQRTPGKPHGVPGRWRLETFWLLSLTSPMFPIMVGIWNTPPRKTYTSENLVKPGGFFCGEGCWPFRRWGLISANRLAPYHWCLPSPSFLLSSTKRGEESESYSHHRKLYLAFPVTMKCILLNHELRRNPFSFKLLQFGVLSQQWDPYSLAECSGLPDIVWWSLWWGPYMYWGWRWRFNIWNVSWTYQEGVGSDLAGTASVMVLYPGGSKEHSGWCQTWTIWGPGYKM